MRRTFPSALIVLVALATAACASGPAATVPAPARPAAGPAPAPSPLDALEDALRARIARAQGGSVGLVAIDLATGLRVEINGRERMHAASTMKVPIMIEVFRQVADGRIGLDDPIAVVNSFRSLVGDTLYALSAGEDSDSTLYARVGRTATVRELMHLMITRSSNLATNILIQHVAPAAIMATMERIGAPDMHVRRGVEDGPAYRAGISNTTTADALATTMEAVARCVVNTAEHCRAMADILSAQEFNEAIPAGVPAGTRVAHKTGWITAIQHDAAIVYPPGRPPFVLVVLTRGYTDREATADLTADLARIVWDAWAPSTWASLAPVPAATRSVLDLQLRHRADAIARRHFTHAHFWSTVEPWLEGTFSVEEAGRSLEGRPIRLLRWGTGPRTVLMWSQMHGDESTATMALADLIRFLHEAPDDPHAVAWRDSISLLMIPMLNPDGAERFVRHNAVGIDVNRDARALSTPEGRALKGVRDRFTPLFGFNLHDQNPRTRVGSGPRTAAIALLAPPFDDSGSDNDVRLRSKRVASAIRAAMHTLVGGHIAKYDESFNPRAFGDLTTQWGTSTVLIESGGWPHDPQKQLLRAVNFVGLVQALDVIAAGAWDTWDIDGYTSLPPNGRSINDLLLRGGAIVLPDRAPVTTDLAADFEEEGGRRIGARITEVGDLSAVEARDTLDLGGLFLHPLPQPDATEPPAAVLPRMVPSFVVRRGADPSSEAVWIIERGFVRRAAGG